MQTISTLKKVFILLFSLNTLFNYSQENIGIPPSPTVASLVTVEKDQVNNSGKIIHNLPLWNMKLGKNNFPITLSYSSSGVKIEEIPPYVGTGWNLSAGGVITRSVIDFPDDLKNDDHGNGILHTNIMKEIGFFQNTINSGGYNESTAKDFFKLKINDSNIETRNDTQPDLFYFSFFGYSGKFVFNKDKEIVSLSNENFIFEYTLDTDDSLKSFTIIDTNGIKYLFSEREFSKTHYNSGSQWEFLSSRAKRQRQLDFYSSWHLKSVTTPGKEELYFEYDDETLTYQIKNSEMAKICIDQQCEDTNISDTATYDVINSTGASTTNFVVNAKKIKKITSTFYNVTFNNTSREDLNGGFKLSQIKISDSNDRPIKAYDFQYSYFLSPNMPSSNNFEYKRLKLNMILENDDLLQEFQYYTNLALPHRQSAEQDFWGYFNDNNSISLVPKVYTTLKGQAPDYHIFSPNDESIVYEYGSVNRNTNPSTVHMGMLKKIIYKTKGYKEFYYEPNDFTLNRYTSSGTSIKGSGVRVDRIGYFDGKDTETLDFDYSSPITGVSSGRVSYLPKFATHIPWNFVYSAATVTNPNFSFSVDFPKLAVWQTDVNGDLYISGNETCVVYGNNISHNYSPTNNPNAYFAMTTRRFSSSQVPLASNISEPLVYEYISIKEGNNGKKLYNFNILGALDSQTPSIYSTDKFNKKPAFKTNYWRTNLDDYLLGPLPQECPNPPLPIGGIMLNEFNRYYQYVNTTGESHPFAPKPNWNRYFGQLKNYTYINEAGYKVFKEIYEYDIKGDISDENTDKKITSLKYRLFNRPIGYGGWNYDSSKGYSPHTGPTAWIWSFYDIYYNIGLVQTSTTITNYYNNETISVTKKTNNTYNYGNLLSSTSYEDSKGDVYKTTFRSPLEFQAQSSSIQHDIYDNWSEVIIPNTYKRMIEKNMINYTIETVEAVNDFVISAQISEYESVGSGISVKRKYKFENQYSSFNYAYARALSSLSGGTLDKSGNMNEKISHDKFDTKGNVLQITKKDNISTTILWGYNESLPIALIKGAKYSDINTWFHSEHGELLYYLNTISNYDTNTSGENNLRIWLNNLRTTVNNNSNGNIQMTSFTYDPLIGVTSITDPRGETIYYDYDNMHRLKSVKDAEGKLLSTNEYHYKSQN